MTRRRRRSGRGAASPPSGSLAGGLPTRLDRRTFLVGSMAAGLVGSAAWLAACGGDDDDGAADDGESLHEGHQPSPTTQLAGAELPAETTIAPRFPQSSLVPGSVRLPISLGVGGALLTNGPAQLGASITDADGAPVAEGVTVESVDSGPGMPRFWIVRAEVATPGIYALHVAGVDESASFQVLDPGQVEVPKPGDRLPPVETPTVDNRRGVDPICTRTDGVCPLHEMSLAEALTLGKPVAYLIGTPAHCQFGVCGPVLDLLVDAHEALGDRLAMVHAEVYTDNRATTPTKAVDAYRMDWEPSLFVADAGGRIVERLDIVYGPAELRDVLAGAAA